MHGDEFQSLRTMNLNCILLQVLDLLIGDL